MPKAALALEEVAKVTDYSAAREKSMRSLRFKAKSNCFRDDYGIAFPMRLRT
jgi:hypothetical protein